jgi:hypothetical protein
MHVPKSAGTSTYLALQAALPSGSLSPRRMEPASFASFSDFDLLGEEARAATAANDREIDELAGYAAVGGHFAYPTLRRLAPPARIGTVMREPRARLISHYLYLRITPGLREDWRPYDVFSAADGSLDDFLLDARAATVTDNKVCRMLMHDDPRVRDGAFIAEDELEAVAEEAWERLRGLGFVGLLELGAETWAGLGALFGVRLVPGRENTTGDRGAREGALPVPAYRGNATLALLERRSAGDALLYRRAASRRLGDTAARRFERASFREQLRRLDSLAATAAA